MDSDGIRWIQMELDDVAWVTSCHFVCRVSFADKILLITMSSTENKIFLWRRVCGSVKYLDGVKVFIVVQNCRTIFLTLSLHGLFLLSLLVKMQVLAMAFMNVSKLLVYKPLTLGHFYSEMEYLTTLVPYSSLFYSFSLIQVLPKAG